jgi:hypothetical protein
MADLSVMASTESLTDDKVVGKPFKIKAVMNHEGMVSCRERSNAERLRDTVAKYSSGVPLTGQVMEETLWRIV